MLFYHLVVDLMSCSGLGLGLIKVHRSVSCGKETLTHCNLEGVVEGYSSSAFICFCNFKKAFKSINKLRKGKKRNDCDMEEDDEIQAQACKFPRLGNGSRNEANNKLGCTSGSDGRFHSTWHNNSSRIVRVSRASGGKDRHSKVMTSKGLRDRRVRLSVTTAIQFYDLQDRLGLEQPSKAIEWLIRAASDAISELPSLDATFPDTPPKQPSDEKRPCADEVEGDTNNFHQCQGQNLSLSKSACSSTSDTSKGEGLSLSRSKIRVKARERARERAAKEKDNNNNNESSYHHIAQHRQNQNHHSHNVTQTASFTELLTGGIRSSNNNNAVSVPNGVDDDESNTLFNKAKQWSPMVMDYFNSGLMVGGPSSTTSSRNHNNISPFSGENNSDQLQQFSFIPDHNNLIPVVTSTSSASSSQGGISGSDYNLNFTISPGHGLVGYNRGTLQSNSPSHIIMPHHHHHHMQRFSSSTMDGSSSNTLLPFFMGGGVAAQNMEANNSNNEQQQQQQQQQLQFSSHAFDGRLQLCYGDGTSRHSDQKGKAKN
ncbi:hypothetical protein RIF29_40495 [Crotalaria pallida]|uniref:Uncharacterized protein n=1 Tax=Crotalaria pallida TaxID=3830 RepID=A0AAN9E9J3_CROPI